MRKIVRMHLVKFSINGQRLMWQSKRDDVAKSTVDVAQLAGVGQQVMGTGMGNGHGLVGRVGGLT